MCRSSPMTLIESAERCPYVPQEKHKIYGSNEAGTASGSPGLRW